MIYKHTIQTPAEEDLAGIFRYYESSRSGVGHEFLLAFEALLERIKRMPESFPIAFLGARRAVFRRFPYSVVFMFDGEYVTIIAVPHDRQNPKFWQDRVQSP